MAKVFADKVGFPEAPVWLPDGDLLIVEMDPSKGCITRLSADGRSRSMVATTGRPNGLALDRHCKVWVAETNQRSLLKLQLTGQYEVIANECAGEPMLFLNDLAFAPDGSVYLTDSGIELEVVAPGGELNPDWRNLPYNGKVYRIDVNSREVECIDRGLQFTNGIAFDAAGDLYVAETLSGWIYKYKCDKGRVVGDREQFGNVIETFNPAELKGPDGMKFGADGNLYVCVFGQGDVTVLDRNGGVARRIKTNGNLPTNLAFGTRGEKSIYVTEVETGTVQVYEVGVDGLPLYN